jgi:hypothetical protein
MSVGVLVGKLVGLGVGELVGLGVGAFVGMGVGALVGALVGLGVGELVGMGVGSLVRTSVLGSGVGVGEPVVGESDCSFLSRGVDNDISAAICSTFGAWLPAVRLRVLA